jgi:hypothetical protein
MSRSKRVNSSGERGEPSSETSYSLISSLFPSKVKILIKDQHYTIGRAQGSDINMPHEAISRRHALIEWKDGGFWIQDVGSTNGTFVNGKEIVKERLTDNDLIEIFPWKIRYKEFQGDINLLLGHELKEDAASITQDLSETITKLPISSGLSGKFSDVELLEVCQLIEFCRKNGTLKIEGEGIQGNISFSMGRIVWAESKDFKGEKAVRELLSLREGCFEFLGIVTFKEEKLTLQLSKLLMDIMKERDEAGISSGSQLELDLLED